MTSDTSPAPGTSTATAPVITVQLPASRSMAHLTYWRLHGLMVTHRPTPTGLPISVGTDTGGVGSTGVVAATDYTPEAAMAIGLAMVAAAVAAGVELPAAPRLER